MVDVKNAHPVIFERVFRLSQKFTSLYPNRRLEVVTTTRAPEDQLAAFKAGKSKIDGVKKASYHNFCPSFAIDVHVWAAEPGVDVGESPLLTKRPTNRNLHKIIMDKDGARLFKIATHQFYRDFGKLAPEFGLEWGGAWLNFFDGPHLQLPKKDIVLLVQQELVRHGSEIAVDGKWGPASQRALEGFVKNQRAMGWRGAPGASHPSIPVSTGVWEQLSRGA